MSNPIPQAFNELLAKPIVVTLATVTPSGLPQATPIWFNYDGEYVWINTAVGRQKDKNLQTNPNVALVFIDPTDIYRWLQVRGEVVERILDGAEDHIDTLSQRYENKPFYGGYTDADRREREKRVIYKIKPVKATHS